MTSLFAIVLALTAAAASAGEAPASPSAAAASQFAAAMNRVEAMHEEVKGLIAAARKAQAAPAANPSAQRAQLAASLTQRFTEDCVKSASLAAGGAACAALEAEAMSPCGAAVTPSAAVIPAGKAPPGKPLVEVCRWKAASARLAKALVRRESAEVCPSVLPLFEDVPADKALAMCRAMLSAAAAPAACDAVSAASGRAFSATDRKECLTLQAARGAKTPAACSGLSKDMHAYCVTAVGDAAGCTQTLSKLAGARCKEEVRDRVARMGPEIDQQAKAKTAASGAAAAIEAVVKKRKELDALLVQIGASLESYEPRNDPQNVRRKERYVRVRASVDRTLNNAFPGKKTP